jgi:hypothetical protein
MTLDGGKKTGKKLNGRAAQPVIMVELGLPFTADIPSRVYALIKVQKKVRIKRKR